MTAPSLYRQIMWARAQAAQRLRILTAVSRSPRANANRLIRATADLVLAQAIVASLEAQAVANRAVGRGEPLPLQSETV